MHPTRRQNRTRGTRGLAVAPIAFVHDPDARHRIDGNANRGKSGAAALNYSRRSGAFVASLDGLDSTEPMTVSFPGRDSRGRKNPRMPRRSFA